MLKRLIENWLINISEREFDIPFRLLLEAEEHISVGHRTIHGPMELGKDIVSYHSMQNTFYFFQLKAGDAKLGDWNDMERQIRQMVEVPYIHPNYTVGDPYQPVWVCTGQLDETVRLSLGGKNDEYKRLGKPYIIVWDRNNLIDKFEQVFFDIAFVEDYLLIDYLKVWSHASDFQSDEDDLREFMANYLANCALDSDRKIKRYLSTFALLLSQLSNRYIQNQDIYSAVDITILGITEFYNFIFNKSIDEINYHATYNILIDLINYHLQELNREIAALEGNELDLLIEQAPMSEIFELPLRTHSLASKIALLSLLNSITGTKNENENILKSIIENNLESFTNILSERQIGTYWLTIVGLFNINEIEMIKKCITMTFEWVLSFHGEDGLQGLPDPYRSYSIMPYHHLDIEPEDGRLVNMNGQSYFLSILLKFMSFLDYKDTIAEEWDLLSRMSLREVIISKPEDLFSFRTDDAHTITYTFPITGSWARIKEHYSQRLSEDFVTILDKYPESLLFLTLAYPWRTQWRETDRYITTSCD